eukprot:19348-Eustigmatos_ZCMA.PRE.1
MHCMHFGAETLAESQPQKQWNTRPLNPRLKLSSYGQAGGDASGRQNCRVCEGRKPLGERMQTYGVC